MSLPNIPDIKPIMNLKRHDIINLMLASIALEEIALSHITNAEGEKIQEALKCRPTIDEMLAVNESVNKTLESIIIKEMLLHSQLQEISKLDC